MPLIPSYMDKKLENLGSSTQLQEKDPVFTAWKPSNDEVIQSLFQSIVQVQITANQASTKSENLETDIEELKTRITSIEQAITAQTEQFGQHVSDDSVRWQQYLDTDAKVQQLEIQMRHVMDGTTDVILSNTTTDIESDSVTGYVVTNPLGGQIVGTAGTYLLVGTGRIWINDTLVFDNAGVAVGIGSKSYVADVNQNDVVKSEALTSLTYTDYISKS